MTKICQIPQKLKDFFFIKPYAYTRLNPLTKQDFLTDRCVAGDRLLGRGAFSYVAAQLPFHFFLFQQLVGFLVGFLLGFSVPGVGGGGLSVGSCVVTPVFL